MTIFTRRRFLSGTLGATLAFIVGCAPRQRSEPSATPSPTPTAQAPGLAADGIVITPTDEFYLNYWKDPSVGVGIGDWRLEIEGLVEQPLSLTYDDARALPAVEEMRALECIGNPVGGSQIGNAIWKGFYLENLLDQVGVHKDAIRAQFAAADGYWTSVDLEWITQPGVLMAYEMNGEPLLPKHGYPLRILMPGLYGQKMPKWITRIHFTREVKLGYWEGRGWSDVASVQTNSQIWEPRNLDMVSGEIIVRGIAYAAPREIVQVELGVNDEQWIQAELTPGPSPLAWTQWRVAWQAPLGDHRLSVRATDSEGFTQTDSGPGLLAGAFPDGTNAIHAIVVSVVEQKGVQ